MVRLLHADRDFGGANLGRHARLRHRHHHPGPARAANRHVVGEDLDEGFQLFRVDALGSQPLAAQPDLDLGRIGPETLDALCRDVGTGPELHRQSTHLALHLLSPADRPVQITADLPGFWAGSWADVRRDLAGRYVKHPWPVDPTTASPPGPRYGARCVIASRTSGGTAATDAASTGGTSASAATTA